MNKIILIGGKKRAGKDYTARKIQNELSSIGLSAQVMAFADPIKDIICTTLRIGPEHLDGLKNNKEGVFIYERDHYVQLTNFRSILQNFGTDAMKKYFGENVWVDVLKKNAQESKADYVIVPDFRFLCEEIGSLSIYVKNDGVVDNDSHRSENELNNFKYTFEIDNTGYRDINQDVKELVQKIIKK